MLVITFCGCTLVRPVVSNIYVVSFKPVKVVDDVLILLCLGVLFVSILIQGLVFTRATLCVKAVYAVVVCASVCLSVTRRYFV